MKYLINFKNQEGEQVPVYMNFGNHDVLLNYHSPDLQSTIEGDYYDFLNNLYIAPEDSLTLGRYDKDRSVFDTVGSYVATDILDTKGESQEYISLMSINSLYLSPKDMPTNPHETEFLMRWIDDVLSNSPKEEKFIITQHIPSGVMVEKKIGLGWIDEHNEQFKKILQKHSEKILITLAGHLHTFKMSLPLYFPHGPLKQVLSFNLGSISPIFKNNPTYNFIKFEIGKDNISFNDILVQEFDLHGLITTERSFLRDILGDLGDIPAENTLIPKEKWVELIYKGINTFREQGDNTTTSESWLFKYILFVVGFREGADEKFYLPPILNRWNLTVDDLYQNMGYNKALY